MNYSRYLTSISGSRQPSLIREMTNLLAKASPDLVFLAGGLPNPQMFPFESASVNLRDGRKLELNPKLMIDALQYSQTQGYPPLLTKLKSLAERLHSPPMWNVNSDLVVTSGSQDGLCKALEMTINPGDYILIQEPVYTGTLGILNPLSPKYLPIEGDELGMKPEALRAALARWSPQEVCQAKEGVPKVMYVNPNACNPTGISFSTSRRKEIYEIAREYNLLIFEDDPYYFVQFGKREDFPPSFLSLDTDGRVLRFDSFSKILSSGLRLGYVSGPKTLIDRIILHMQVSTIHASVFGQVLVNELLSIWGEEGFLEHMENVQKFYHEQRDAILACAEKHLTGLCEWNIPTGGMFLWIKVTAIGDTWDMIMSRALSKNVILVPGRAFMTDAQKPCPYMRAAFSLMSPEAMDKGLKSLSELIHEEILLGKK